MKTQSKDTDPVTEKFLIKLMQGKSIQEKFESAVSLSSLTISLSKRAIKRANADKTQDELDIIFLRLHYGDTIADNYEKFKSDK